MVKVMIKYSNEDEKLRMIQLLSTGSKVKKVSEPYKSGKFYRIYLDIE